MDLSSFSSQDVQHMLHNKFVVIIGDSIQRGIYKDFVRLLQSDCLLKDYHLKQKGEKSFLKDELIEGGIKGEMTNRKHYREVRQYHNDSHLVRFYIVTRCYGEYVETILEDLRTGPQPDVVIMNSCLWDVSRYGPTKPALEAYKINLQYLCTRMKEVLPEQCVFIWNTTMPVGKRILGGFLIQDLRWMENHLTWLVKEANHYALQVMDEYGVDVNDLHYHFRDPVMQYERRVKDGIHWDPRAHRMITTLILTHICRAWDVPLFERYQAEAKQAGLGLGGGVQNSKPLKPKLNPGRRHNRANTYDGIVMHVAANKIHADVQRLEYFLDGCDHELKLIDKQKNQHWGAVCFDDRANQIQALQNMICQCDKHLGYINDLPVQHGRLFDKVCSVSNRLLTTVQLANSQLSWLQHEQMNTVNTIVAGLCNFTDFAQDDYQWQPYQNQDSSGGAFRQRLLRKRHY